MDYFIARMASKVTFGTAQQNRKPQMPSSGYFLIDLVITKKNFFFRVRQVTQPALAAV